MSFASTLRSAALALALTAPLALGGCTLTPVYGDAAASQATLALNFAEPGTRLEQIVYQTLSARLGGGDASAPVFTASVSSRASRLGVSEVSAPMVERQVLVTVNYSVTRNEETLASGSRTASVGYQTSGQYLTDDAALAGAREQAARAAADSVRLALIAALGTR